MTLPEGDQSTGGAVSATVKSMEGPGAGAPLLVCSHVSKRFGGVHAVRDVSLTVREGGIVSLIGPNGAGKTSLFNCLSGYLTPDTGTIVFDGTSVAGVGLHRAARLGLVRTFQNIRMFSALTVMESLIAAQHLRRRTGPLASLFGLPKARREWKRTVTRAEELAELLRLTEHRNLLANRLPLLEQRKLEVGRALATDPRLVLLDEPSAGATPREAAELVEIIRRVNATGISVLLIEHSMSVVMEVSQWIHVMHLGELLVEGTPTEIASHAEVRRVYLGDDDE